MTSGKDKGSPNAGRHQSDIFDRGARGKVASPSGGRNPGAAVSWFSRSRALRVPEITVYFWVLKGLSTAMGEATSDYSVHAINPYLAVILGFVGFVIALVLFAPRKSLPRLDLLVCRRHGGRVRHHGG